VTKCHTKIAYNLRFTRTPMGTIKKHENIKPPAWLQSALGEA